MVEILEDGEEWSSWDEILNNIEMSRNIHASSIHATIICKITIVFVLLHELKMNSTKT